MLFTITGSGFTLLRGMSGVASVSHRVGQGQGRCRYTMGKEELKIALGPAAAAEKTWKRGG
jgi:hypothetical protein